MLSANIAYYSDCSKFLTDNCSNWNRALSCIRIHGVKTRVPEIPESFFCPLVLWSKITPVILSLMPKSQRYQSCSHVLLSKLFILSKHRTKRCKALLFTELMESSQNFFQCVIRNEKCSIETSAYCHRPWHVRNQNSPQKPSATPWLLWHILLQDTARYPSVGKDKSVSQQTAD